MLEPEKYDDELRSQVADFEALLPEVDATADVPTCPGWSVHDLVDHLGYILSWSRAALVAGEPAHPPEVDHVPAPAGGEELRDWFCRRADGLVAALDDVGTEQPCWGFGERPRTSAFWWRRMTHEMAVHLYDLRTAHAASTGEPVEGPVWHSKEVACDAVEEVATVFFPRQVRLERCEPLQAAVLLMPDDVDGPGWVLSGEGGEDDAIADVTVTGPIEKLALLLWHRVGTSDEALSVMGDEGAVDHVMASEITP